MFELLTIEQWDEYTDARGYVGPNSIDPDTSVPYISDLAEQAKLRATDYIFARFINGFKKELRSDTFAGFRADIQEALIAATAISASNELENPHVHRVTYTPPSGQEVKKVGSTELFASKDGETTTHLAINGQFVDTRVHLLLDPFLITPVLADKCTKPKFRLGLIVPKC